MEVYNALKIRQEEDFLLDTEQATHSFIPHTLFFRTTLILPKVNLYLTLQLNPTQPNKPNNVHLSNPPHHRPRGPRHLPPRLRRPLPSSPRPCLRQQNHRQGRRHLLLHRHHRCREPGSQRRVHQPRDRRCVLRRRRLSRNYRPNRRDSCAGWFV